MAEAVVLRAVANKAMGEEDYVTGERFARDALSKEPNCSDNRALLAHVLMQRRLGRTVRHGFSLPPLRREDWPEYAEVVSLFRQTIARTQTYSAPERVSELMVNLSLVHTAVGDLGNARSCLEEAIGISPGNVDVVERYLFILERLGDYGAVVAMHGKLPESVGVRPSVRLRVAQSLPLDGRESSETEAEAILGGVVTSACDLGAELQTWAWGLLGQYLLREGRTTSARFSQTSRLKGVATAPCVPSQGLTGKCGR